jgi:hypothetical protein
MNLPREILERAREAVNKTMREAAAAAGISLPCDCDLEDHDDEITMCIDLDKLRDVCRVVSRNTTDLFPDDARRLDGQKLAFTDITRALEAYLMEQRMSLDEFEDKVGWNLHEFLANPELGWKWNIDCLRDVCGPLGIDWIKALPN